VKITVCLIYKFSTNNIRMKCIVDKKGIYNIVAILLIIAVVVVLVFILYAWSSSFAENVLSNVGKFKEIIVKKKLIKIESVEYSLGKLILTLTPRIEKVYISYVVVLKDGNVICKENIDKVISEPYSKIEIRCVLLRGNTYIVKIFDKYMNVVAEKSFTIGN